MSEKEDTSKKGQALKWAKQFETARRWLSAVKALKTGSEKTQSEYAYRLKAFCEWAKKNPDQLIAERKAQLKNEDETINRKTEELVTEFFNFQAKQSNRMSAKSYHGAIRSFYKYNYTLLRSVTPKARAKTIFPITIEEFKQIDEMVIPRDRALLRFMKDSGLSTEDVVVFNYGDIKKEFEEGKDFIHLRAVRQKMQINYNTFIGPNAVEALKFYFQIRKQKGEVFSDGTPLFPSSVSKDGKYERLTVSSVRTVFDRIKRKTGITVSPHRIRKLFSSRLSAKVRHPVVLKHWMGHGTGGDVEGSYVLPPLNEQLEIYKDAYSEIDIKPKITISREELTRAYFDEIPDEMLEPHARKHGLTVAQYRTALRERKLDVKKEDRERPSKTATDGGCINGHCQRIVSEEELPQLLANGWTFVATLPSGKCVVSNETS